MLLSMMCGYNYIAYLVMNHDEICHTPISSCIHGVWVERGKVERGKTCVMSLLGWIL